jgi:hypothetical protein
MYNRKKTLYNVKNKKRYIKITKTFEAFILKNINDNTVISAKKQLKNIY